MKAILPALAALTLAASPADAQHAVGFRYGRGDGTARYNIAEMNGRYQVISRVYITAIAQFIGGNWACTSSPVDLIRCNYDGTTVGLGAAVAPIDSRRVFVALNAGFGGFFRKNVRTRGYRRWTGSIGADAEFAIWDPIRLQVGYARRKMFDGEYRELVGVDPHFTSITAGLTLILGPRRD